MKSLVLTLTGAAMGLLGCPAICPPLAAEEPPANNRILPAGTLVEPRQNVNFNVANLALNAIQVAANTDLVGIELAQVDDVLRSHLDLGEGKGLVVSSVAEGGPAAAAGIQKFDVLVTIGGQEISGLDAFRQALETSPDKPIELGYIRAGKKQAANVTPRAATAGQLLADVDLAITSAKEKYWLGVGLAAADDTLLSQLSLLSGGLVVTSVESDSPAAKAGVMVNDVLTNLDNKPLAAVEDLSKQLQEIGDKPVSLELLRRGKPATLTVLAQKRGSNWTNIVDFQPLSYRIVYTPNVSAYWDLVQPAKPEAASDIANVSSTAAAIASSELVKQIGELESQLKQLEASLASLRSSLHDTQKPPEGGDSTEKTPTPK